jgi:hypothetical protein
MVHARTHTHTHQNQYVNMKIRQCYGMKAYIQTERVQQIMKNKKREKMHTDRCGNTSGQKCHAKGSRRETKIQQFVYRDTANVEHEMCDCTGNNWSHRSGNKRFKEMFVSHSSITVNRCTTTDSCTWNVARNTESTAVWNLKSERWESSLVQENYQGEKARDKRQ